MDEIVTNEKGGKQSKLEGMPHAIPSEALLRLSEVCALGAKRYALNNWRLISFEEHIGHALEHLFLMMRGDRNDDHLGHALTRLAFAVATETEYDFRAVGDVPVVAKKTKIPVDAENPETNARWDELIAYWKENPDNVGYAPPDWIDS